MPCDVNSFDAKYYGPMSLTCKITEYSYLYLCNYYRHLAAMIEFILLFPYPVYPFVQMLNSMLLHFTAEKCCFILLVIKGQLQFVFICDVS